MKVESGTLIEFQSYAPISKEQLRSYADASGDFNPIHLDEEVARGAGLPGVIAHGMLIAAFISNRALDFVEKNEALKGYEISFFQTKFKSMALLGDIPSIGGIVKEVTESGLSLDLQAKNQKGEVLTTGIAKFKKLV